MTSKYCLPADSASSADVTVATAQSAAYLTPWLRGEPLSRVFPVGVEWAVFDADDTCWWTHRIYQRGLDDILAMLEEAGFARDRAWDIFHAIERDLIAVLGFSRHRHPLTVEETYRQLCAERGVLVDEQLRRHLCRRSYAIFMEPAELREGIRDLLEQLHALGIRCALLTKGDPTVQHARLDQSGLRPYFNHVEVVPGKTPQVFQYLAQVLRTDLRLMAMIGDSIKNDINPAVDVGLRFAIHLPSVDGVWVQEQEKPRDHGYVSLADARDVLPVFEELVAPPAVRDILIAAMGKWDNLRLTREQLETPPARRHFIEATQALIRIAHLLDQELPRPNATEKKSFPETGTCPLRVAIVGPSGADTYRIAEELSLPIRSIGTSLKGETAAIFRDLGYPWVTQDVVHRQRDVFRPFLQEYAMLKRCLLGERYWVDRYLAAIENEAVILCDDPRTRAEVSALAEAGFVLIRVDVSPETQLRRLVHRYLVEERLFPPTLPESVIDVLIEEARGINSGEAIGEIARASPLACLMASDLIRVFEPQLRHDLENGLADYPFAYQVDGNQPLGSVVGQIREILSGLGEARAKLPVS